MRTIRFYHPTTLVQETEMQLEGDAFHHAINVLRCKKGYQLELFDGKGQQSQAEILSVERRSAQILIQKCEQIDRESSLKTGLIQGISKGERMDYVLQKATELGVSQIQPVITERCNVQLDDARWEKRHEHWRKITISACEQSGRNVLPELFPPISLEQALQQKQNVTATFLLHPEGGVPFDQAKPQNKFIEFIVGSEGGFSEDEVNNIKALGIQSLIMGPRILRSETCPVAALAIAQFCWGDFS